MTKELEALEVVAGYIPNKDTQLMENGMPFRIVELFLDEIDLIRNALTPPTEEEVCKALSEWSRKSVYYSKELGLWLYHSEVFGSHINLNELPKPLIALIGRFYEKEAEK